MLHQISERLGTLIKSSKRLRMLAVIAALSAAVLMFLSSLMPSSCAERGSIETGRTETAKTAADPASSIEKRLEDILSRMDGVGRAKVMLTLDRTGEQVLALDEKSSGSGSGANETRPATVQSGGREEPIVLTEVLPRIRGVIVIAEGAASISVRQNILAAVSTVLGIEEKAVEVFVMAGSGGE
ncbi:MAG: hypothetical protein IKI64_11020 [Clostridia bacterium]|nr:hypothetical protein [Clostridia bacterium]